MIQMNKRPLCPHDGRPMIKSEDGINFVCPICHEYATPEDNDECAREAERQLGA